MDVARAAMGHGWPFAADPRSNDGARGPQRSWGRMSGLDLLVSFGAMPKETRSAERNRTYEQCNNAGKPNSRIAYETHELAAKAAPTRSLKVSFCLIAVAPSQGVSRYTEMVELRTVLSVPKPDLVMHLRRALKERRALLLCGDKDRPPAKHLAEPYRTRAEKACRSVS